MKILVALKRNSDTPGLGGAAQAPLDPYSEQALAAALQLRLPLGAEVVLVSLGDADVLEALRYGLALGADRAVHLQAVPPQEPLALARLLQPLLEREQPQLLLLGARSATGYGQLAAMLAGLCDWPQASAAIAITPGDHGLEVVCRADSGCQTLLLPLPAVISLDAQAYSLSPPSVAQILQARAKPLASLDMAVLGLPDQPYCPQPQWLVEEVSHGPRPRLGRQLHSAAELAECLRKELSHL